jgi:hypothetical protein
MEENESVEVEETTEEPLPETNTEEAEASEVEESIEESSEETENTAEAETEQPKKSRATERIRELVAQKKALEAQLRQKEPEIEGVDETGIDPNKFADSLSKRTASSAQKVAQQTLEYFRAEQDFPVVKDNNFVRSRAGELVDQGFSPYQAAEIASLEWQETTGQVNRKQATSNLRQKSQIPSAGKKQSTSSGFSRADIDKMSPQEYVKNEAAIQAQLEKYGPDSFE